MRKLYVLPLFLLLSFKQFAFAQANDKEIQVKKVTAIQHENFDGKIMSEDEKINYLLNYLRNLKNVTFIRNGDEYSPGKAADHLESKWKKHKRKVKTAHDFVDRIATFSKTKEPYKIRFQDGQTTTCGELLNKELSRLEQSH